MQILAYARRQLVNAWRREPNLLEIPEAAKLARVSERSIKRWLADGTLAGVDKGFRGALIPKACLIDFMCGEGPPDEKTEPDDAEEAGDA
ncbi:MAG: helix-turn-helix domain-containing protein [Planctomycetes bacterium]|nr:helix-turn-helix domain-containing protein [Planctomycetota bacterium]